MKEPGYFKKLVSVLTTSTSITDIIRGANFEQILYIWYPVQFRQKNYKDKNKDIRAPIDLSSKVNIIHPTYTTKLGFCARKIDISAQKINRSHLDIFRMVIVNYSVKYKLGKIRFFQETFLLANISLEVVLQMFFLIFGRTDVRFIEQKFVLRTYTAIETLPTTRRMEIIDKREFTAAVLNADNETLMVYIVDLAKPTIMPIYSSY